MVETWCGGGLFNPSLSRNVAPAVAGALYAKEVCLLASGVQKGFRHKNDVCKLSATSYGWANRLAQI